jgi:hypothetical protein
MADDWRASDETIVKRVARAWAGLIGAQSHFDLEDFEQDLRIAWLELKQEGRAAENALRDKARYILRHTYHYWGRMSEGLNAPVAEPIPLSDLPLRRGRSIDIQQYASEDSELAEDGQTEEIKLQKFSSAMLGGGVEGEILREEFWKWVNALPPKDQKLIQGLGAGKTYQTLARELGYADHTGVLYRARALLAEFLDQAGIRDGSDLRPLFDSD